MAQERIRQRRANRLDCSQLVTSIRDVSILRDLFFWLGFVCYLLLIYLFPIAVYRVRAPS